MRSGTGSRPVVRARRSTASTSAVEGRFTTTSRVARRLSAVCDRAPRPSTAVRPSQNTDDIGARFTRPSPATVLSSATGVPKYRIPGSMTTCEGAGRVEVVVMDPASSRAGGASGGRRTSRPRR
ncbi:hypothetical protein A0J59_07365 [Cellulosimicrobium sp. I38E]|nr:hypothetical protein A0J59_07365 [Cellulosimicrobium sp. I38E]